MGAGNEKMDLTKASSDQTKAAMALANSNMANNSDGSFHIYLEPKKKPKPIAKTVEIKKEVKNDKTKERPIGSLPAAGSRWDFGDVLNSFGWG